MTRRVSADRPTRSPWPVAIAVTLPVAEAGILFGVAPLAVAGLVALGVAVVAGLREAAVVSSPARAATAVAGGFGLVTVGFALADSGVPADLAARALAVGAASGVLFAAAGWLAVRAPTD